MLAQQTNTTNHSVTGEMVHVDEVVRKTIEEITGNSLKDISAESHLEDDLGISTSELMNIINKIQMKLEFELSGRARAEILSEAEYVQDMIEIINEEYEF
jgi:acyl carrier protein